MTSIEATVRALLQNNNIIKEHQAIISDCKKQNKELTKEIQTYLNQKNQKGIQLDENIYISLEQHEKKLNISKKDHYERVRTLLYSKGIDDEEFIDRIFNKTSNIVQEQKIKINKDR